MQKAQSQQTSSITGGAASQQSAGTSGSNTLHTGPSQTTQNLANAASGSSQIGGNQTSLSGQADLFRFCPYDGYKFSQSDVQCLLCKRSRDHIASKRADPPVKASKKQWSKVLYKQQGLEDNYFDSTFLSSLVQKNDRSNVHLREVIEKTLDLTWTVNLVAKFLLVFHSMQNGIVYEGVLVSAIGIFSMVCMFFYIVFSPVIIKTQTIFKNIKRFLILLCTLYVLSPIMRTVNETYADNTTYALSIGLIIYFLIFKDYSAENITSPKEWKCDSSMLAAYAFSAFLGSRLKNDFQVFTLLFSSLMLFFFSQFFKRAIKGLSIGVFKSWNLVSTVLIFVLLLLNVSKLLAFLYLLGQIFITFICPMWLIWLYQYKRTFHGPWDLPEGIEIKE